MMVAPRYRSWAYALFVAKGRPKARRKKPVLDDSPQPDKFSTVSCLIASCQKGVGTRFLATPKEAVHLPHTRWWVQTRI